MSTDKKFVTDLENRYPPGHETRQAVARYLAGLRIEKPYKRTVRVLELSDHLDGEAQKIGQALTSMVNHPSDDEPVTVAEQNRNDKATRYSWEVDDGADHE